jgi:hypothetical protein
MGEKRIAYRILVGKPDGRDHWEDQDIGGWTINIQMDLREIGWDGVVWIGLIWLRIGTSGGLFFKYGIEPSGSMKCWEVLEWLPN